VNDWSYEPASDIDQTVAARMRRFPREPDMTVYLLRSVIQIVLRGLLRAYNRFEVHGRENLPADASFVMVCNHVSHLDALCLLSSLPIRQMHAAFPAAAADYFFSSLPRTMFSAIAINGLPFDRSRHSQDSLAVCRQLLAEPGHVLILFPEGTRSVSGATGRFRSGVARLVAGTMTPVVPCHLSGAYEAWPKGAMLPRPRALCLRIGHPRVFLEVAADDRDGTAAICRALREDVIALAAKRGREHGPFFTETTSDPFSAGQPSRSTSTGSIRAARRAGSQAANAATSASVAAAPSSVAGSRG
jgi:1-acyl-sn-glycerol-3-phosphate acyltransferase